MRSPRKEDCSPASAGTMVDCLEAWASRTPDHTVFRFLGGDGRETSRLQFSALRENARAIAAALKQFEVRRQPVVVLLPTGPHYIASVFACWYAGAIAVPSFPGNGRRAVERLAALVSDCRPAAMIAERQFIRTCEKFGGERPELRVVPWLAIEDISAGCAGDPAPIGPDEVAVLQYTSGSTSEPRAVILSHQNLMHSQRAISLAFEHSADKIGVNWLPLHHDMGLIGNVLQPVYAGGSCVMISPMTFALNPLVWLQAVSRYHAATSGGPNFAFDLCARKATEDDIANLDLSAWKVAYIGAEPVRVKTLERFARRFVSCGFQPTAFYPCYGLAEAALMVSGGHYRPESKVLPAHRPEYDSDRPLSPFAPQSPLVSCGRPVLGARIAIVDPLLFRKCSDGTVGEIWASGPSISKGYWNRAAETEETFRNTLADCPGEMFARTGDYGFILDEELYVSGRRKDLIIIRGENFYPQDIERCIEDSDATLRRGSNAAFSINLDGAERLVVVQEVENREEIRSHIQQIARAARASMGAEFRVALDMLVLVRAGTIPRTSSGKIQRYLCREQFLTDRLSIVAEWNRMADSTTADAIAGSDLR
jgi:acyl-CoA synthetase (AMP-forming)/AMP-acid ligase II